MRNDEDAKKKSRHSIRKKIFNSPSLRLRSSTTIKWNLVNCLSCYSVFTSTKKQATAYSTDSSKQQFKSIDQRTKLGRIIAKMIVMVVVVMVERERLPFETLAKDDETSLSPEEIL